MKILITGGAGFQGRHLVQHFLQQGHNLTIIDTLSHISERNIADFKDKISAVWGSITDKEIVDKTVRGHDVVFHLAARINVDESIKDPYSYIEVNVKGTLNVLEAVNKAGARLIHASTCEVYGAPLSGGLINEHEELRPQSPYAASKASADRLCYAYFMTYGTKVTIVRPFNIYGEYQKEAQGGALIAILVKKAIEGKPLIVFGTGEQTRDYMHVSDLVRAYDLVFQHDELIGETINFGTGIETKVKDIAEFIAKQLSVPIEYGNSRPGEVERFACDVSKAKSLGFEPKMDIWDGIKRYIEWKKGTK